MGLYIVCLRCQYNQKKSTILNLVLFFVYVLYNTLFLSDIELVIDKCYANNSEPD